MDQLLREIVDDHLAMESAGLIEEVDVLQYSGEAVERDLSTFMRGINLFYSVEALSTRLASKAVDEESFEDYRVSVEAMLAVSGLKVPASILVPAFDTSFESAETEKKQGVLKRLLAWLREFLKKIWANIRKFFGIAKMKFVEQSASLEELRKRIGEIDVNAKPKIPRVTRPPKIGLLGGKADTMGSYLHMASAQSILFLNNFKNVIGPLKTTKGDATVNEKDLMIKIQNAMPSSVKYLGTGRIHLRLTGYQDLKYEDFIDFDAGMWDVTVPSVVTLNDCAVTAKAIVDKTAPLIIDCGKILEDILANIERHLKEFDRLKSASDLYKSDPDRQTDRTLHDEALAEIKTEMAAVSGYKAIAEVQSYCVHIVRDITYHTNTFGRGVLETLNTFVKCYQVKDNS